MDFYRTSNRTSICRNNNIAGRRFNGKIIENFYFLRFFNQFLKFFGRSLLKTIWKIFRSLANVVTNVKRKLWAIHRMVDAVRDHNFYSQQKCGSGWWPTANGQRWRRPLSVNSVEMFLLCLACGWFLLDLDRLRQFFQGSGLQS